VHPFASMPPSVRVNGAMGSSGTRTAVTSAPCGDSGEKRPRCVQSTDAIHTISTSTHTSFGDRPIEFSPVDTVCNTLSRRATRFSDLLALLQGVFSPAMVAIEQLTSDAPVTHFSSDAPVMNRERTPTRSKPRSLRPSSREKRTASSTRGAFHRSRARDHDILSDALLRPAPISRFCHRDPMRDADSPGAVSRFGLVPVHRPRASTRKASLGSCVVERFLQHDTKRGHTLRALRPSHVLTSRGQDTLSLRDTPFRACGRRAMRRFSCEGVRTGREPRVRGIQRRKERL